MHSAPIPVNPREQTDISAQLVTLPADARLADENLEAIGGPPRPSMASRCARYVLRRSVFDCTALTEVTTERGVSLRLVSSTAMYATHFRSKRCGAVA